MNTRTLRLIVDLEVLVDADDLAVVDGIADYLFGSEDHLPPAVFAVMRVDSC